MPWDVFISHASEEKAAIAKPLVDALQRAGVSVWLDATQIKLGDSLREQIDHGLKCCRFGVVIVSKAFFKKRWTKKELNALIGRETADGCKVILPILYDMTIEDLRGESPLLADKVAACWSDGINRVVAQIAEVVLGKSDTELNVSDIQPPAGSSLPKELDSLVLILSAEGRFNYFASDEIELSGGKLKLVLRAEDPDHRAFLADLEGHRSSHSGRLGVAYGTTAHLATVNSVLQRRTGGKERATVELHVEEDQGSCWSEMAFNEYSADDIAAMRARRILLNEKLPSKGRSEISLLNSMIADIHVSGHDGFLKVKESLLPRLYAEFGESRELFLALAKLLATLCLRLTNTIEHVLRLDMRLLKGGELHVDFSGRRPRRYSNEAPPTITVKGTCDLRQAAAEETRKKRP